MNYLHIKGHLVNSDVIVVGAGFAGLRAAGELTKKGLSVTVLEARDRVGGRVCPGQVGGHDIDLGGMWLGPTQRRLDALTRAQGLVRYPTWLVGECGVNVSGKAGRAPGEDFDKALGTPNRLRLLRLNWEIERIGSKLDVAAPWDHPQAENLDSQTVASWVARRTASKEIREVMNVVCAALFCTEAREMSMLFFAFYCKSAGGLMVLLAGGPGGAQNFLFDGSLHSAAARMAEELGDRVILSAPVAAIDQDAELDLAVVTTTDGSAFTARRVIMAVPPPIAAEMSWNPRLSANKRRLLAKQAMGSTIKAWLAYDEPFWRRDNHNAFILDDTTPFSPIFDATPPGASKGLISGFFESVEGRSLAEASPEERQAIAVDTLVRHLGPKAAKPLDYIDKDWTSEEYSRGCYGAVMPPGVLTTVGSHMREPHGLVHWAGTETATEWSGYVEGALQSGERAASEVAAALST